MKRPVRKKKRHVMAPVVILLAALALGVGTTWLLSRRSDAEREPGPSPTPEPTPRVGDVATKEPEPEEEHLREDKSVYADTSEFDQVVTMYLTVRPGNAEDSTDHTWTEVNSHDTYYYSDLGIDRYACEAILQVGDENGPVEGEFGYGETVPNATVCIRGQTSSRNEQKNYKVRIKDGKGTYKDMQTLPLNKYQSDDMRFRNKLVFDLYQSVPQLTSIRTQFVHLYVKDETEGGSGEFEDYGLYTRLEQMNKDYLENHGLDSKGHFYKMVVFEFLLYEPLMMAGTNQDFDEWAFEEILKPKGDTDNTKLREMLQAVNDYTVPIQEIVEKYFDVENISYFLAANILVGNYDCGARNEYLYSPLNSDKWYFLSWDCDDSFRRLENLNKGYCEGDSWERGMTQFLGLVLFNRMFREQEYRDALTMAVEDLRSNYFTKERIKEYVDAYSEVVFPYLTSEPDVIKWSGDEEKFNYIANALPSEIDLNYQYYLESLEKPWPFYVGLPEETEDGLRVNWDVAYDMDGEDITYTCILARDPGFTDVIARADGIRVPGTDFDVQLAPGQYFIRVQATNESGYTMENFDYYTKDETFKGKRYGCFVFQVDEDGTYVEIEEEE